MNKKPKRELSLILVIMFTTILLTGCSEHANTSFYENGSGSYRQTVTVPKDLWDNYFAEEGENSAETAIAYYGALYPQAEITISDEIVADTASKVLCLTMDFNSISEYQQIVSGAELLSVTLQPNYYTSTKIYMPLEEETTAVFGIADELDQLSASDRMTIKDMDITTTITFPYTVTDTNGSLQEDHKTVIWDMKKMSEAERLYALFHKSDSLSIPKYTGAVNGNAYNTGVTLTIQSENLLDHVKVNDETTCSDQLFLSAEDIYDITAVDINGNSSHIKFRIDTTKPSISGVKNGKTYKAARTIHFSDKGSGIKSAFLNGETIRTGKKITRKGTYTLTVSDKAGNQKIVKFSIK